MIVQIKIVNIIFCNTNLVIDYIKDGTNCNTIVMQC